MFRNMKVGLRLSLGFAVVFIFMIAIIIVSSLQMSFSEEKFERIVKVNNARIKIANNIIDCIRDMVITNRGILLSTHKDLSTAPVSTNENIQTMRNHILELRKLYAESYAQIKPLINDTDIEGIALYNKLGVAGNVAIPMHDKLIEMVISGKHEEAIDFMFGEAYPTTKEWMKDAQDFINHSEALNELRYAQAQEAAGNAQIIIFTLGGFAVVISALIIFLITIGITRPLKLCVKSADRIASGDLKVDLSASATRNDELGLMIASLSKMVESLRNSQETMQKQDYLKTGIVRLNKVLIGDPDLTTIANNAVSEISTYLDAKIGAIFLSGSSEDSSLTLMGSYAYTKRKNLSNTFKIGEGLIGQAALEKQQILIKNVPEDYIRITSGLGEITPAFICVSPIIHEGRVKGVVEVGTLQEMTDQQLEYIKEAMPVLAIAVESANNRMKLSKMLEESQTLTEELQTQQEELRASNEELENKTLALQSSEESLKAQQEELQATNEELEEKTNSLEQQKTEIIKKNVDLDNVRIALETKANELAVSSKYKSEFLANMSHELRTPLNSLLLLSKYLADNKKGNLDEKQIESVNIILKSGQDLLNLINEILDLSKIEAGKMTVKIEKISLDTFKSTLLKNFRHIAEQKKLDFKVDIALDCPTEIYTDHQRIEQIANNLISNALKFTEKGSVAIKLFKPDEKVDLSRSKLNYQDTIAFSVKDTGIGIPKDKHLDIFEAFQQADGSTSRKFGGTGLGLSISRELVRMLGGEIQLRSEVGLGSTFTVYMPIESNSSDKSAKESQKQSYSEENKVYSTKLFTENYEPFLKDETKMNKKAEKDASAQEVKDDRNKLSKDDRVILIVEDDDNFAQILKHHCNEKGFKALIAIDGESGIETAISFKPEAIILDLMLPGMDGWEVMESIKENTAIRHIPVHIVSCLDPDSNALQKGGAIGYAQKPLNEDSIKGIFDKFETVINRPVKKILLIEDDNLVRMTLKKILAEDDIDIIESPTGKAALEVITSNTLIDCIILDMGLPDINGKDLLKEMGKLKKILPPVIVYTGRDIEPDELKELNKYTESVVIKGVKSQERLVDEVSLFLHQVVNKMPDRKKKMILNLHESDNVFKDKKVLIVDDDLRNIFALTGLFEEKGMVIIDAENGREALQKLEEDPKIDIILMDIMMPVMDGYETIKEIRKNNKYSKLPIIAVTAKAMPEDKAKCIDAGANDYLAKPVKADRLFSMMRVWLYKIGV